MSGAGNSRGRGWARAAIGAETDHMQLLEVGALADTQNAKQGAHYCWQSSIEIPRVPPLELSMPISRGQAPDGYR